MKSNRYSNLKFFFERHSWLWWFLQFVLALLLAIGWFFVWKQYQLAISQTWNGNKIAMVNNWSWVLEVKTMANQIIWDVNYWDIIKQPTKAEEKNSQMQIDAKTNLETFFDRRERGDIEKAYIQLDTEIASSEYFQTGNLMRFKNEYLKWKFYLDELTPQGDCKTSIFVDRCEFNFKLRYVSKLRNKSITEKRYAKMLINKDKFDYFKVWSLSCIDKNCENNPLFWSWS